MSTGATINPLSGVAQNFTSPVEYTVTAEDNVTTKVWTVTVTEAGPPPANFGLRDDEGVNLPTLTYWFTGAATDITEKGSQFEQRDMGVVESVFIKGANIQIWKTGEGNVTGAQFKYKVWNNIDTEPETYTVTDVTWTSEYVDGDFTNQTWSGFGDEISVTDGLTPGTYNLKVLFSITGTGVAGTTDNGPFVASFEIAQQSSEAEILSFNIDNQIGQTIIDSENATVNVQMLIGTNVSALQPTIAVSAGAAITPESGAAQDFTNSVTYTVTAENQQTKVWVATVQLVEQPVYYSVSFNVDMTQAINDGYFNPATDFVDIGADYNNWAGNGAMSAIDNNIYTQTTEQVFEAGDELLFKFRINGNWQTTELLDQDNRKYIVVAGDNSYSAIYNQPGTTEPTLVFANLQYPDSASIALGQTVEVYAQVEVLNTDINPETGYQNLVVWIGLNNEDTNPNTWTNWQQAIYNGVSDITGKHEYKLAIGQNLEQIGTYYYASRFKLSTNEFMFGGFSSSGGGFWNGIENKSGVLSVTKPIEYYPVTFDVTNNNTDVTLVKIKGTFNDWTHVDMENTSGNVWKKTFNIPSGNYEWGVSDQDSSWLLQGSNLAFTVAHDGTVSGTLSYTIPSNTPGSVLAMERWISYIARTNESYATGAAFNGSSLGVFNETSALVLNGGKTKTIKSGNYNVTGASMYYRFYNSSQTPGDFAHIDLPWKENLEDANQQIWENVAQTVNVTQGLTNGNYLLETYFELHYKIGDETTILSITDNNAGANYKAGFVFESNVSINDNANELAKIKFYPNPAVESVMVDLPDYVKNWTITIYNSQGQIIKTVVNKCRVNVSGFINGVYWVELKTDKLVSGNKVIIMNN